MDLDGAPHQGLYGLGIAAILLLSPYLSWGIESAEDAALSVLLASDSVPQDQDIKVEGHIICADDKHHRIIMITPRLAHQDAHHVLILDLHITCLY